jgi:hypothetical protein
MTKGRESVVIPCREPGCENVIVLRYDSPLPRVWTCPVCEDRLEQQMVDELARRDAARVSQTL